MRTTIELAKNDNTVTSEPLNSIKRTQNRVRQQKKKNVEELNQNNETVIRHTNDENIDNNIVNNNIVNTVNNSVIIRPSIGKWMYERDDLPDVCPQVEDVPINLSTRKEINDSDDDIVIIESFSAGPSGLNSGLNTVRNEDININDLNPTLVITDTVIEEVIDMSVDEIQELINVNKVSETEGNEMIVIDESIDSNDSVSASAQIESTSADDIEIIRVRYLNEPTDSDIEVLSEILSPQEVIDLMRTQLKNSQNLTQLSFTTLRIILNKYQWNKDLFVSDFFEIGIQQILNHYKLVISYELKTKSNKRRKIRHNCTQRDIEYDKSGNIIKNESNNNDIPQEMKTCLVCMDDFNISEVFAPNCGHCLCVDCWRQYVSTHVSDSSNPDMITCPGDNCPNIIDDDDLLAIIEEQKTRHKYQRLISNNFVEKNPLLRWCPNGDCYHAVRVKENGFQDVECICKTVFCFLCGDRWHEPLTCQQHKNWIQRYASQSVDSKSAKWLTKHTKCCPKCRFPIEKNGGCNYVLCAKCRHQFCYQCLGRCSHGRCLGQNLPDAIAAQANDQWLKDDLSVYPTIKLQYQKQSDLFTIEHKLQKDVSQKLELAVKCPEFKSALKFLKSAFTVLCHCRQTLMYSYVFGYYLIGPTQLKDVFNQNLKQLETQTEYLSKVLTTETAVIKKECVLDIRRKVQPIYKECANKRTELVRHIRQLENYWHFKQISI